MMRTTTIWLKRVALVIALSALSAKAVSAQPAAELETTLTPGMVVWITDSAGREEKTRIVSVSGDTVTASDGGAIRRLRTEDIKRVRVRRSDSVLNGALIGAGAAVASALLLCRMMEPWDICLDAGPILRIGAVGAGIGIGIDALVRGRRTLYEAPQGLTRLHVAPIVGRRAAGVQVSISF